MKHTITAADVVRFWSHVDRRSDNECWPWMGKRHERGYGELGIYRGTAETTVRATHVMLMIAGTPVPAGMMACHKCDNPPCVNPKHLFIGSARDNTADMVAKGRAYGGDRHYTRTSPEKLRRGADHGMAKLTDDQVREIRAAYIPRRMSFRALGRKYEVDPSLIMRIVRGEIWTHVPMEKPQ